MAKSVGKQYADEMKNKFGGGYHATWAPGVPLAVGDIGEFDNEGIFQKKANLKKLQIPFEIYDDGTISQLDYVSKGSASVITKLSGQTAPEGSTLATADAGIIVNFSKESAVVFSAKDVKYPSIEDQIKLERDIIRLYKAKKWDRDWCIITELAKAEGATIIISNSSNSKIELKANAKIAATKIDIADAAFNFSTQFSKDVNTAIISQEELTPLFKVKKLKGLFQDELKTRSLSYRSEATDVEEEISLEYF